MKNRHFKQQLNEFPINYISTPEPSHYDYSFSFIFNKSDKYFLEKHDYFIKVKLYYFLESDISKIIELLNTDIRDSRIQTYNSNTTYSFRIRNAETLLNCGNSNVTNIDPDKLELVFKEFIKEYNEIINVSFAFRR